MSDDVKLSDLEHLYSDPLFTGPFTVEVDDADVVWLLDGEGGRVSDFNTHTQLPLDRQDLLDQEREHWRKWAQHMADSLNTRTAANADVDRLEGLLSNRGVGLVKMWSCYGGGFMLSVNGVEHHAGSVADAIDAAFKRQIK